MKRIFLPFFYLVFMFLAAFPFSGPAQAQDNVSVSLIADQAVDLKGGETITLGIVQEIAPGWHTYWKNPGDSGTVAEAIWEAPSGFEFSDLEWPMPHRLPFGPLMNFGYEEKAVNFVNLTLPETLPSGPQNIGLTLNILVCEEICVPETHEASIVLNGNTPSSASEIQAYRETLPLETGWDAAYAIEGDDFVLNVALPDPEILKQASEFALFPEEWGLIRNSAETIAAVEGTSLTIRHKKGERDLKDVPLGKMVLTYTDAGGEHQGIRLSAMAKGAAANGSPLSGPEKVFPAPDISIWQAALLAMLGGLILNLMPCVFPVLSMKALSLVKLKDKEASKAQISGLAYTAGVLVSFALIAAALLILKSAGAQIGWGFQLQNPLVIGLLAMLLFMIGLNLAGLFEFSGRFAGAGASLAQKQGASGSFFTGVLATLVATPCTAPFMGVAMGFALTQSAPVAMGIFLMLGFGLALPYLLLAFIPALRHILPKPGAWMEKFKEFLAFPMFASAAWLVWVLAQQAGPMGVLSILLSFVMAAFAIWVFTHLKKKGFLRVLGMIAIIASLGFVAISMVSLRGGPISKDPLVAAAIDQNWEDYSAERLDTYLQEGYPVFVNMTAAWCITCKVNERVALNTDETRNLFESRGIKYLKGDWTNRDPEITKFLSRYGRGGVPLYVYYGPRDENTGQRPEPKVLAQILTPSLVKDEITNP